MRETLSRALSAIARPFSWAGAECADWIERNFVKFLFGIVSIILMVIVMWPQVVINIPAGHAGVLWSRFFGGTVMNVLYRPGAHIVMPWDIMTVYDMRVQLESKELDVLTSDGLHSTVDVAFRFHIDDRSLTTLHEFVGPDYLNKLIVTDVGSQARRIFSQFLPEEAFTRRREYIEDAIQAAVEKNLVEHFNPRFAHNVRFITMDDVMIRSVKMPEQVAQAIERKVQEYHRAEQYAFTLEAERREAERKAIEAEGVRQFQDIVRPGLSDNYLRWRGIEATLSLAQSPNSKTVIIGSGPGGLPIILGNMEDSGKGKQEKEKPTAAPAPATATAKPAAPATTAKPVAAAPAKPVAATTPAPAPAKPAAVAPPAAAPTQARAPAR